MKSHLDPNIAGISRDQLIKLNQNLDNRPPISDYVGVHVRRTDYLPYMAKRYQGVEVRADFFLEAFRRMRGRLANPIFVVTTDDPNWADENLAKEPDVFVASGNAVIFGKKM